MKAFVFLSLSALLVIFPLLAGCTLPGQLPDTIPPENETAVAIAVALSNTSVRAYLTGDWTITGVALNATTAYSGGVEEITTHTPAVIIDTESRILHVYVDLDSRTVVHIWDSPKREPYP